MGKHYQFNLTPNGWSGDPIPIDPCVTEARRKEAVNKAGHTEFDVTITPKEKGDYEGTEAIPEDEIYEDPEGRQEHGMFPLAPPKKPHHFRPCGTIEEKDWDSEDGDVKPDGNGGLKGGFQGTESVTIEETEWSVDGLLTRIHLRCKNPQFLALDRIVMSADYSNISDADAIQDLLNTHAPEFADLNLTSTGQMFDELHLGRCSLMDALNFIATASGGLWFYNHPTGEFIYHGHSDEAFKNPKPVSTSNPSEAINDFGTELPPGWDDEEDKPNVQKSSAKCEESKEEVVNEIIVEGGGDLKPYEEQWKGDGEQTEYHLSNRPYDVPVVNIVSGEFTIPYNVYLIRSTESPVIPYCYYSEKDRYILFPSAPAVGDVIHCDYNFLEPVRYIVRDTDSIAQWGLRQRILIAPTPRHYSQLKVFADRVVSEYSQPPKRGEAKVYDGFRYRVGDLLCVKLDEIGISELMTCREIERQIPLKKDASRIRITRLKFGKPAVSLEQIINNIASRLTGVEAALGSREDAVIVEHDIAPIPGLENRIDSGRIDSARIQ
jgi:hypothetical protein